MKYHFLTDDQFAKLLANGSPAETGKDHVPVVKLFTPDAQATWMLTEIVPDEPDIAFGLCDVGLGFPELGYVSLLELSEIRGRLELPIERDTNFEGKHPLSIYAEAARFKGQITDDPGTLEYMLKIEKTKSSPNPPQPC